MTRTRVRPTRLSDVERVELREFEREYHEPVLEKLRAIQGVDILLGDWARTLADADDRPLAIVGAWPHGDDAAMTWAMLTDEVLSSFVLTMALQRMARECMEILEHERGITRIEGLTNADFDAGVEWMEVLGFVNEDTLLIDTPSGGEQDLIRFVRVH